MEELIIHFARFHNFIEFDDKYVYFSKNNDKYFKNIPACFCYEKYAQYFQIVKYELGKRKYAIKIKISDWLKWSNNLLLDRLSIGYQIKDNQQLLLDKKEKKLQNTIYYAGYQWLIDYLEKKMKNNG